MVARSDDDVTDLILRESIAIHRELGPRLFESVYETVLAEALAALGVIIQRQVLVPITWRGRVIGDAFRIDLLVEERVVVECKSLERLAAVHSQQLLTYLRLGGYPIGLLINFGQPRLMDGVKRVVNSYRPPPDSRLRVNRPSA